MEARACSQDIQAGKMARKDLEKLNVNLLHEISALLAVTVSRKEGRAPKKEDYVNPILPSVSRNSLLLQINV